MKELILLVFSFASLQAVAQSTEDSVRQVINRMFQGMRDADSAAVAGVFHPNAVLQTVSRDGGIRTDSFTDFATSVKRLKKGQLDERIDVGAIHIDGPLASVWTPYRLYFDGNFMHCGANSFQLARTDGVWRIVYLIDTRRKNCDEN